MRFFSRLSLLLGLFALALTWQPHVAEAQVPERRSLPPLPTLPVAEGKRVALVIGNSNYLEQQSWRIIPNAARDALYVSHQLRNPVNGAGRFEVLMLVDANYEQMKTGIERFTAMAAEADVALVYYAGHGFEFNLENYLVPVDAPQAVSPISVERAHIKMADVIKASTAKQFSLFFLDACRTTDALRNTGENRAGNRASLFGAIDARGSGVIYSASRGESAYDAVPAGATQSPFAKAVIRYLNYPGLNLYEFFSYVSLTVEKETAGFTPLQSPTIGGRGGHQFFMVPRAQPASTETSVTAQPTPAPVPATISAPQTATAQAEPAPPPPPASPPSVDWGSYEQCMRGELVRENVLIPRANCASLFGLEIPEPAAAPIFSAGGGVLITLPELTPLEIASELLDEDDYKWIALQVLEDYSIERLKALSEQDDPLASVVLGYLHFEGLTVERSLMDAKRYLQRAAATGHPEGLYALALFQEALRDEEVVGIEFDRRIDELYREAYGKGNLKAGLALADLYSTGLLPMPDEEPSEPIEIWKRFAEMGDPTSHMERAIRDIDADFHVAALKEMADQDNWEAASQLCLIDYDEDPIARLDYCLAAAEEGDEMAIYLITVELLPEIKHDLSDSEIIYWARIGLNSPYVPVEMVPCLEALAEDARVTASCTVSRELL